MAISLRPYQQEATETILQAFNKGITKQLITLPTGSGKTIIMAALAKALGKKTLVLAHREELITQASAKFNLVWPEVEYSICMANSNEPNKQVVFGSVQSCCRDARLDQLKQNDFELILVDEAHHASASSYQKTIESLGFLSNDRNKLLVGVTATPMRSDDRELGDIFEKITYSIPIETMIQEGYLSQVIGRRILTRTSIHDVHTRMGDFAVGELSEAVNTPERNQFIAKNYAQYASKRKGIAFCCDVQHCKSLAKALNSLCIPSKAIHGELSHEERKSVLQALKTGEIQVVTSCGILTEGFDEPTISCIAMARPTKSKGLYIQCVGRGLRPYPSKQNCLVLDFADEGHNLTTIVSLGKAIPQAIRASEPSLRETSQETEPQSLSIRRTCDEEFDILGKTKFIWVSIGDDEWSLVGDNQHEIVITPEGNGYTATIYWNTGHKQSLVEKPIPLDYCSGYCEDFARVRFKLNFASSEAPWLQEKQPPTENQLTILQKRNINTTNLTRAQASMKIRETLAKERKKYRKMTIEPATNNQVFFLKQEGIDALTFTKLEASKTIAVIKKAKARHQTAHSNV